MQQATIPSSPATAALHALSSTPSSGTAAASTISSASSTTSSTVRRCRALYECVADNDDELSFREGEVIVVVNDRTDDEHWMLGSIEGDPSRRGLFPISFVHMLAD